jgi:hypothetical protein
MHCVAIPARIPLQRSTKATISAIVIQTRPRSSLSKSWTSGSGYWDSLAAQNAAQDQEDVSFSNHSKAPSAIKSREMARDFIHRSLYDPAEGYFSNPKLEILSPTEPLDWSQFKGYSDFLKHFQSLYSSRTASGDLEPELNGFSSSVEPQDLVNDSSFLSTYARSQVWHTPTELFQPWFGYAIASYLIAKHSKRSSVFNSNQKDKNPLVIYEMGPGNGTLMLNILDYLQAHHPRIYEQTEYHLIEISSKLASNLSKKHKKHASRFKIIQKSILEWDQLEKRPCFVLAMEVIVNLLLLKKCFLGKRTNTPYKKIITRTTLRMM